MLTAEHHPCQALADLLTLREAFGRLEGLKVTYVGDGNNVARSLVILGRLAGVEVVVAAPDGYALDGDTRRPIRGKRSRGPRPSTPTCGSRWATRRRRTRAAARSRRIASTPRCSRPRRPTRIALHCLPAHPGEEITEEVLYGPRQRIWDQAENRRHAQKALLELLVASP